MINKIKTNMKNKTIHIGENDKIAKLDLDSIAEGDILHFDGFNSQSYVVGKTPDEILTIGRRQAFDREWISKVVFSPVEIGGDYELKDKSVNVYYRYNYNCKNRHGRKITGHTELGDYLKLDQQLKEVGL